MLLEGNLTNANRNIEMTKLNSLRKASCSRQNGTVAKREEQNESATLSRYFSNMLLVLPLLAVISLKNYTVI